MKTRKNMTRPHASVHFKNGQNDKNDLKPTNAKNAHENEKKYNRATCLCVFPEWAKCQQWLKSIELNKKFYNQSTSEGKMKDVVV